MSDNETVCGALGGCGAWFMWWGVMSDNEDSFNSNDIEDVEKDEGLDDL